MVNGQEVKTTNSATDDLALQRFMEKASELQDVLTELWGMANMLADSGYDADVALVQANAPADPALLALARLGAMVISGYLRQNDTAELCLMAGLTEETPAGHAHRFPGIIDAIARLLAPDGADGAGGGGE